MEATSIRDSVREHYAELARSSNSCCGSSGSPLYDEQLIQAVPADISGFSLGCGDPITLAQLKPGETVLDLGSGGGLDCFLASKQVGQTGHVIGVDMTPDMLAKARANAQRLGYPNVEFREGYLEALPVDDHSVDVVISNCVINLSPDKPQVFREVFRTLKPGGRVAVSDIVTNGTLPPSVQQSMAAWGACVAGALDAQEYVRGLSEAGFVNVRVQPKSGADQALAALPMGLPFSATITADKPVSGQPIGDLPVNDRIAPLKFEGDRFEALLSQIVSLDALADGYDVRVTGDAAEIRSQVEELAQAVGCCSPLKFSVIDAADGTHVRIISAPDTAFVSLSSIN
jgi:SAM-dependent methyltransferase